MNTLRRILTGTALLAAASSLAFADGIVSYTATSGSVATDITNLELQLPGWDPGGSNAIDFTGSTTMHSLVAPLTTFNLQFWTLQVTSAISGTFTITNDPASGTPATGSATLDSYTAVALGANLSPALTGNADSTNDIFYIGNSAGVGPDPTTSKLTITALAPGGSDTKTYSNVGQTADYGCFLNSGGNPTGVATPGCGNDDIASLAYVESHDPLNFFFSTATEVNTSLTGGNNSAVQSTTVVETITLTYDYSTVSGVPEPATYALLGSALVGLGLLRKRLTGK
jgi:hypothetical protein